MLASTISVNTFTASIQDVVQPQTDAKSSIVLSPEEQLREQERKEKAAKIDAYFGKYNLPLTGYGMVFVTAGEKHGVDPFLLAGIAMRESTGCKFIIKGTYNCFGWGGGKVKFESFDQAIDKVAEHLAGKNERTARYYKGKSVKGILETYNPPSVVSTYAAEVMGIMKRIDAIAA